jgi:hypothetical protein
MEFLNKEYLLLLLLLIPYLIWYLLYRKKSEPTMQMSDTNAYRYAPKSLRQQLVWLPDFLRMPLSAFLRLETYGLLSLPLILIPFPRDIRMPRWLGYALYPAHLVLLYLLELLRAAL